MAQQLLRRPVPTTCTPSILGLSVPVLRPHKLRSYVRVPEVQVLCPFRAAQSWQCGSRGIVVSRASKQTDQERFKAPRETRLPIDQSPVLIDGTGDPRGLPRPSEYQQTLWCSFTIAGIGLHTGEYACVRVRPAFAGEGRYFVRVPEGTNMARATEELDELVEGTAGLELDNPEAPVPEMDDPQYREELIMRYQQYVDAQEEDGYSGAFMDFLEGQQHTELIERLRTEGPPEYSFSRPEPILARSEEEPYIPATADFICDANPVHTCMHNGEEGERELEVRTVEALLSALEACGVDNARIEIEGGVEVPVIDGTADGWSQAIFRQGLRCAPPRADLPVPGIEKADQPPRLAAMVGDEAEGAEDEEAAEDEEDEEEAAEDEEGEEVEAEVAPVPEGAVPKLVLRPVKVITVCRGTSFVTLYPEDSIRLTAGINMVREAPVIGSQWLTWCMYEDPHYMYTIADARPYVVAPEHAIAMREAGWLQGGTEDCMLIGFGDRWYDPEMVRYSDEPVRHEIQNMIGDLSLLSRNGHAGLPYGHVVSYNADHELYAAFVVKLLEETTDDDWVPLKHLAGASVMMDLKATLKDAVAELSEEEGEGARLEGGDDEEYDEYPEPVPYGEGEDEEEGAAGGDEYEEAEEGGEFEEGDFEDEDEEGVVDVEASPSRPPKGRR